MGAADWAAACKAHVASLRTRATTVALLWSGLSLLCLSAWLAYHSPGNLAGVRLSSARGLQHQLWECLPPHNQTFHVVIAAHTGLPTSTWLPWVEQLGLTGATLFLYVRQDNASALQVLREAGRELPCDMRLHVVPLVPNHGHEAAVYMRHISAHYDNPPAALMLAHGHGPAAWHMMCGPFYRRVRAYHLGLVAAAHATAAPAAAAERQQQQPRGLRRSDEVPAAATSLLAAVSAVNATANDSSSSGSTGGAAAGGLTAVNDTPPPTAVVAPTPMAETAGLPAWLTQWSGMMVSLSSGCKPWARWWPGCCAATFCGQTAECRAQGDTCPNVLAGEAYDAAVYDRRVQNRLISTTLLHLARTLDDMQPPPLPVDLLAEEQGYTEAYAACHAVLDAHNVTRHDPSNDAFWTCCTSVIVPGAQLTVRPKAFYDDMYEVVMRPDLRAWHTGRCLEYHLWHVMRTDSLAPEAVALYHRVDELLPGVTGCPAYVAREAV